ncbi:hypothetical protein HNY73_008172 [Argiope bruennichi]|uniref:Uncharacterized protein n=1 Tax=Argiope bruennichi TaxID=94029 RepID=A0A8T0F5Q8_ARGBR|nr:hypothetical protein HNY73_008172 [Argiope bruennichi]
MAKYENCHRRPDYHTKSSKEISVSVNPRCFNLAESGEGESNFEISNNNPYPLYFKVLTTNAFAMCFQPRQGRVEPQSKVIVKGYHVQSTRPIGLQQKVAVMTSHLPLHEWPEDEYYQPILSSQDGKIESHTTKRHGDKHAGEYESTDFYREHMKSDKMFCCFKNPSKCKIHHRDNIKQSSSDEKQYHASTYCRDRAHHKSNDERQFHASIQNGKSSSRPEYDDHYALHPRDNVECQSNENHYYKSGQHKRCTSKPYYEDNDNFKRKHELSPPHIVEKGSTEKFRREKLRTKANKVLEENFNLSIICHCKSCCAFNESLQSDSHCASRNKRNVNKRSKTSKSFHKTSPKVENLTRKRMHKSESSPEDTESSMVSHEDSKHTDNSSISDDLQDNSDESATLKERGGLKDEQEQSEEDFYDVS